MYHLQRSRIFVPERPSDPVFVLDGIASEWLFAVGFWNRINRSIGTIFDQYEEDEAAPAALYRIAEQLLCAIRELEACDEETIQFRCGWLGTGEPHILETPRTDLISQLVSLQSFLALAAASGITLELSL